MKAPEFLLVKFWDFCKVNDDKRLAKQTYPTDLIEDNNIQYIDDGRWEHRMDVYYPQNTTGKLPVIVDIHGGGWFYGDKELNKNYCLHLAQRGFVVFNISYRLVPESHAKEQLQDVMFALDFIAKHMKDYPCDERCVSVVGDSAGGQLASFAAAANLSEKVRDAYDLVNPDIKISALGLVSPVPYLSPRGLMSVYMPHVLGNNYEEEKYSKYVDLDTIAADVHMPPTMLFTSFGDVIAMIPTLKAYRYLKSRHVKAKIINMPKFTLMHVYQVLDPEAPDSVMAINKMTNFFKKQKSRK